jgi:cystathionine beta-lyase family protein involved in aluminum resistance
MTRAGAGWDMGRTKLWAERGNMAYSQGKSLTGVGNTHMASSQLGGLVTDTGMRCACRGFYIGMNLYTSPGITRFAGTTVAVKKFLFQCLRKVKEFTSTDAADIQHWVASLLMRRSSPQLTHCHPR